MQFFRRTNAAPLPPFRDAVRTEAPATLLLVAVNPARRTAWERAITTMEIAVRLECFDAFSEAMLRSSRMGPHGLIVDADAQSVLGAAVQRFLARCAPQAHVLWVGGADIGHDTASNIEMRRSRHRLIELLRRIPQHFH